MNSNEDSLARGIKNVLSLKRQNRDDASSIKSDNSKSPRRGSQDSTGSKIKAIITNSRTDDAELSDGKKSSKSLLGFGKLKDKARRKSQVIDAPEDRGRDTEPKTTISSTGSKDSLGQVNDENSLISESDTDLSTKVPPLVNRPSHQGYLTSSSPQVKATFVAEDSPIAQSPQSSPTRLKRLLQKPLGISSSRSPSRSPARPATSAGLSNTPSPALTPETSNIRNMEKSRSPSPSVKKDLAPASSGTIAARRLSRGSETANLPTLQLARGLGNNNTSSDSVPSIVTIPDTPPQSAGLVNLSSPVRAATAQEDFSHRPLAAKSLATHRRIRSDGPPTSKLSQSMAPPLTPLEEAKTPAGSRHTSGASLGGGFFSSVFSVAQNAANTLTNTLQTTTRPKTAGSVRSAEKVESAQNDEGTEEEDAQENNRPLAIETIGSGDLGMHHLGITIDPADTNGSPTPSLKLNESDLGRSRSNTVIHNEHASAQAEGVSAARAVSAAYSSLGDGLPAYTPMAEDVHLPLAHPAGLIDIPPVPESKITAINGADDESLARTTSIRSKLDRRRKRGRNSSGATVGAAIAASHNALMPNNANKFAGFPKPNAKRNKDFHGYFRSVPDDDELIEDYSAALQREIILAGRIYISEGHICFSSNIMGWVTNLVISFDEIVSIEKESTAMLFANAIAIQTLHARHTFRSLLSRDTTYDLMINIWRLNHPGLESSENGVRLASGTGSKTQRILNGSDHGSEGSINSGSFDSSRSDDSQSFMESMEASVNGEDAVLSRKVSAVGGTVNGQTSGAASTNGVSEKLTNSVASLGDFPGPAQHSPTECNDPSAHLDKLLKDEIIPAPLGKVYSLVFGPASASFMTRWLEEEIKVADLQMEDKKGLSPSRQSRTFSYIKPLANPLGPKNTKCIITEHLDFLDLERSMTVSVTTQTPDVPSGNLFSTKTKYCFMWGPNSSTRIIMTYTIEWTGKSWLKGPIEKGATDGQTTYANDLVKALKSAVSPKGRAATQGSKSKRSRRLKNGAQSSQQDSFKPVNWGPLQPLHDRFTAISHPLRPLFSSYSIIGFLLFLLIISWFRNSRSPIQSPFLHTHGHGDRVSHSSQLAKWEHLWQSEEEALWEWLQDRTGLHEGVAFPVQANRRAREEAIPTSTSLFNRLRGVAKPSKDVEWAIKLTEDRLASLKEKVGTSQKQKSKSGSKKVGKQKSTQGIELTEQEAADLEGLLDGVVGTR